jgi:hypothetical protein
MLAFTFGIHGRTAVMRAASEALFTLKPLHNSASRWLVTAAERLQCGPILLLHLSHVKTVSHRLSVLKCGLYYATSVPVSATDMKRICLIAPL